LLLGHGLDSLMVSSYYNHYPVSGKVTCAL
jgi:hypothetical protein